MTLEDADAELLAATPRGGPVRQLGASVGIGASVIASWYGHREQPVAMPPDAPHCDHVDGVLLRAESG